MKSISDVRARIAEALREHGTSAIPTWANERICLCGETFRSMPPGPDLADHVADVLLSLTGIAVVDKSVVEPLRAALFAFDEYAPTTFADYQGVAAIINASRKLLAAADVAEAAV